MTAIPQLDPDELYLAAILDDPSGIELAEFCIAEGTLVLTRRGHVPIQDVLVGDEVLTHRGRWRRVTAVLDRGVRDVVTLKGVGLPGITMTSDHRLYARKARQGLRSVEGHRDVFLLDPDWVEAADVEFGGAGRVRNTRYATPAAVAASEGALTPERAWLLGRWIADGSKSHTPRGGYVISWAIRDRDLVDFKIRLKSAGFDRATVTGTASPSCWSVTIYNKDFFAALPQGRAENKKVPTWVFGAEEHLRQQVLDGYLSGDGYWSGENWQASTVSAALAYDLRVLASTLGWSVSLSVSPGGQRLKFGGIVQARELWSLTMTDDGGWSTSDGLHQWSMLKSRSEAGRAHVWDLSVEEDHSFVAAGVVVHNCWVDEEKDDRCFRLWDYQYKWYSDESTFQIDQAGRSLGKSVGITMRAFAFPFNFPGQEMLITAPELNHLRPITDKVENLFLSTRLGREMLPKVKGGGINHQPQFQARFINGARVISRLPNRDGRGIKGMHPLVLELDEGQDYPEAGWVEIIETMKAGSDGAQWRAHGVSRGVRDTYYRMTQNENPDLPFKVHRYMAPHRPTWSEEERRSKIAIYGGTEDNVDYRRNIFGEHGDAHNPLFVLARLMSCVRINESAWASQYNDNVYAKIKINDELHRKTRLPIESFIDLPANHLDDQYVSYWGGADIGYTNDPTEILIWGVVKRKGQPDLLRQLARIQLQRISAQNQADVIRQVFRYYGMRLRRFALDKTGNGLPLWQMLRDDPTIGHRIAGYGFSEKKPVEFDDREPTGKETMKDLVIEKNVIEFASDELRRLVDMQAIELPYDVEQLTEFQGQSVTVVKDSSIGGVRKRYSGGSFHTLDAARMLVAGKTLESIEKTLAQPVRQGPVLDQFFF